MAPTHNSAFDDALKAERVPALNQTMPDEHFCSASSQRLNYRVERAIGAPGIDMVLGPFVDGAVPSTR
jgi:hypothetical protein